MKTSHQALILGLLTESVTTLWFVVARASEGDFPKVLLLLHAPGLILILEAGAPLFLAVAIEAALWVLVWFLLLSVFDRRQEGVSNLTLGIHGGQEKTKDKTACVNHDE